MRAWFSEVCIEKTSVVLMMLLERNWVRSANCQNGANLAQFIQFPGISFASGMPIVRDVLATVFLICGWSGGTTSAMRRGLSSRFRYDAHCRHAVEQNINEAVNLHTKKTNNEDTAMDKDRIKGSAEQAKGAVKEAVGKVLGDKKLETDGKTDKAAGKVQNAIGGLKDAVRGK